jgi:hypothetical protein
MIEWRVHEENIDYPPFGLFEPSTDKFYIRSNTLSITHSVYDIRQAINRHSILGDIEIAVRDGITYYDTSWISKFYKIEGKDALHKQMEDLQETVRKECTRS